MTTIGASTGVVIFTAHSCYVCDCDGTPDKVELSYELVLITTCAVVKG